MTPLGDALRIGAQLQTGVDAPHLGGHGLGLVHADRVHVGGELPIDVRGLELLGVGETKLADPEAREEVRCRSPLGAAARHDDDE